MITVHMYRFFPSRLNEFETVADAKRESSSAPEKGTQAIPTNGSSTISRVAQPKARKKHVTDTSRTLVSSSISQDTIKDAFPVHGSSMISGSIPDDGSKDPILAKGYPESHSSNESYFLDINCKYENDQALAA